MVVVTVEVLITGMKPLHGRGRARFGRGFGVEKTSVIGEGGELPVQVKEELVDR